MALRVTQVPDVQVSPEPAVWPRGTGAVIRVHTVAIDPCITDVRPTLDAGSGATITCMGEGTNRVVERWSRISAANQTIGLLLTPLWTPGKLENG